MCVCVCVFCGTSNRIARMRCSTHDGQTLEQRHVVLGADGGGVLTTTTFQQIGNGGGRVLGAVVQVDLQQVAVEDD